MLELNFFYVDIKLYLDYSADRKPSREILTQPFFSWWEGGDKKTIQYVWAPSVAL